MRIDAYTHFFPKKFFDKLNEVAGDYKDMGKRVRSLPALYDLDVRKKIVDGHKDYQQILSYPQPPIERFAKSPQDIDAFCRIINDGFAELCAKEKHHFPGWVAHVSLDAADAVGALAQERPQLAIIDLLISGGAGLELCRDVHARGIPVLALSSVGSRDAALEAGASAFLQKPLEPLQLVSAVKDLLGTSSFLNEVVPAR